MFIFKWIGECNLLLIDTNADGLADDELSRNKTGPLVPNATTETEGDIFEDKEAVDVDMDLNDLIDPFL